MIRLSGPPATFSVISRESAEVRVVQILDREVHGDGERRAVLPPHVRLEQRLSQDPERELAAEPRRLHFGHELERSKQTALGMPPPHEGLDSADLAARDCDHRLVVEDELVLADRTLQLEPLHSWPSQSVPLFGTSRPRCL
jgi:hypothetical protein